MPAARDRRSNQPITKEQGSFEVIVVRPFEDLNGGEAAGTKDGRRTEDDMRDLLRLLRTITSALAEINMGSVAAKYSGSGASLVIARNQDDRHIIACGTLFIIDAMSVKRGQLVDLAVEDPAHKAALRQVISTLIAVAQAYKVPLVGIEVGERQDTVRDVLHELKIKAVGGQFFLVAPARFRVR